MTEIARWPYPVVKKVVRALEWGCSLCAIFAFSYALQDIYLRFADGYAGPQSGNNPLRWFMGFVLGAFFLFAFFQFRRLRHANVTESVVLADAQFLQSQVLADGERVRFLGSKLEWNRLRAVELRPTGIAFSRDGSFIFVPKAAFEDEASFGGFLAVIRTHLPSSLAETLPAD